MLLRSVLFSPPKASHTNIGTLKGKRQKVHILTLKHARGLLSVLRLDSA